VRRKVLLRTCVLRFSKEMTHVIEGSKNVEMRQKEHSPVHVLNVRELGASGADAGSVTSHRAVAICPTRCSEAGEEDRRFSFDSRCGIGLPGVAANGSHRLSSHVEISGALQFELGILVQRRVTPIHQT
jgi:hypothetical protein